MKGINNQQLLSSGFKCKLQQFILILLFPLFAISSCNKAQSNDYQKRPNLIIFQADQWAGWDLGFLGAPVQTPNIDHFASQSLVLTNAVANYDVCTPSRAMLQSGQYPETNGVYTNPGHQGVPGLKKSTVTWSDVLSKQGYNLGYIGKWHLDAPKKPYVKVKNNFGRMKYERKPPFHHPYIANKDRINGDGWTPPDRRHGFNFWYAYGTYDWHMHPMYWSTYVPKTGWFQVNEWEPTHDVDVAIKFIKNVNSLYRDPNKPFALKVSVNPPHMPYDFQPKKYQKKYQNIPMDSLTQRPNIPPKEAKWGKYYRDKIKGYYASMTGVDAQFGRILKTLKANGLKDNTIVLFLSDHGNQLGIHNHISKSVPYEESINVPFIMRYPGHIQPRRDSLLFSMPDVYPTLLDLMGMKNKIPSQVEGKSYAHILTAGNTQKGKLPDYQLYIRGSSKFGDRGLRTHRYTFVMGYKKNKGFVNGRLFDRWHDPYQMHNIYQSRPKLVKQFKKKLKSVLLKRNDPWGDHFKK